jgi:intracellular sulfur oxidation DsrE/DsrF family protein
MKQNFGFIASTVLIALSLSNVAQADEYYKTVWNSQPCPVVVYDPAKYATIDAEFGAGAQAITQCLTVRHNAKVVVAVGRAFPINAFGKVDTNKATFLSNIKKMVRNYEVNGMKVGKDVKIKVVFTGSGAILATTQHPLFAKANGGDPANPFRSLVEYGLSKGFEFYLCQTASRTLGINMSNKIPGIDFVIAGHIAVADFQMQGYALIEP